MRKIVIVGGGSSNWGPRLLADLMLTPSLAASQFLLHDIHLGNGQRIARFGAKLAQQAQRQRPGAAPVVEFEADPDRALEGADFVIITISTGGLAAMAQDLSIPEEYGIYATVGDTAGPGGWSRTLRNVPVFLDLAERIRRLAPHSVVLNYTNPMAQLTRVLAAHCGRPVVGLCHGLFENLAFLKRLFSLDDERQLQCSYGGINHFFWMTALTVKGQDGLALLEDALRTRTLPQLLAEQEPGREYYYVADELYRFSGLLPYLGDRHTSEFFSPYLTAPEAMRRYHLVRTTIDERLAGMRRAEEAIERVTQNDDLGPYLQRSRETAADIINAFVTGQEFQDVGNLPNCGQIANLPSGAVVETPVLAGPLGFRPVAVGPLPEPVRTWVERHIHIQELTVQAAIAGDLRQALTALALDPQVAHLTLQQTQALGMQLLHAHKQYLPQFRGLLGGT